MALVAVVVGLMAAVGLAACSGSDDEAITVDGGDTDTTTITTGDEQPAGDEGAVTLDDAATDATADLATATPVPPTATPVTIATPTVSVQLADTAFTNRSKVTTAGIDEVIFGTDALIAAELASTQWIGYPDSTIPECFIVLPANGPDGIEFWVWAKNVERFDITQPALRTRSGYGVGTQLAQLQQELGDLITVEDQPDGTQWATFTPADAGDQYRLLFEVEDGLVTRYRSGRAGIVELDVGSCGEPPDPSEVPNVPVSSSCPTLGVLRSVTTNVPEAVQSKALAIQLAAKDCDLEALEALTTTDGFTASFGGGTFSEVYENNGQALGELARMFGLPARLVTSEGETLDGYVWPQAHGLDWSNVTDEMKGELEELGYDDRDFETFDAFGGYLGQRAFIDSAGEWIYYVAGD